MTKNVALTDPEFRPHQVIGRIGLAACSSLFGDLALFAVLATQTQQTGFTLVQVGILLSIHRIVRLPANPLAGLLADRWGRRAVFWLGMALAVLSTAGYGIFTGFWLFLLCRLMWGIAWAMINTGGLNILLDLSTPANRGQFSGMYNAWIWGGYALGPLIGGILVDIVEFRPAMIGLSALSGLGLIAVLWGIPETKNFSNQGEVDLNNSPKVAQRIRSLAGNFHLWLSFLLYAFTRFTGDGILLSTLALLLKQRLGERILLGNQMIGIATLSGIAMAVFSLLAGLAGKPAGRMADGKWGRLGVIQSQLGLGIVGFALLGLIQPVWGLVVGLIISAVSSGGVVAALTAYMGDQTSPQEQGILMGLFSTAGDIGSMAGPVFALSLASSGHIESVYLVSIGIYLLGMLMAVIRVKFLPEAQPNRIR